MDFFGSLQAAAASVGAGGLLHSLPPDRWDRVSVNGIQNATVIVHGVGMKDGVAWCYFTFRQDTDGAIHTLLGQSDGSGHVRIYLSNAAYDPERPGHAMENARITVQPIVQGLALKVSIRYRFTALQGHDWVYRFDGRSWP